MSKRETALVTGAGGFIGRHLVADLLASGQRVIALDVNLSAIEHTRSHEYLRLAQLDIRCHDAVCDLIGEADVIYHLAAAHLEVGEQESYYHAINVVALHNMLNAAAKAGVRRFIHCSTVGVYGPLASTPADEETQCHPDIAYEKTKLEGERAVIQAAAENKLSAVIIRPSWVYGPQCPRTEKLLRSIRKRRFFFVGNGENLRHPIYINDLLRALQLAATAEIPSGEVIIAAGPEAVTTRDLVTRIQTLSATRHSIPTLPLLPVLIACRVLEVVFALFNKQPPFSTRSLKFFTESSAFDGAKAQKVLGFTPTVALADGLAETIARIRGNTGTASDT